MGDLFADLLRGLAGGDGGLKKSDVTKALRRDSLGNWLPWVAYDPADQSFLHSDETYGYYWECVPHAFVSSREIVVIEGLISKAYPDKTVMQFILYGDDNIEPFLAALASTKKRKGDLLAKNAEEISRFYREGTKGVSQLNGIPIRNFRLFFCIKAAEKIEPDMVANIHDSLIGARLAPHRLDAGQLLALARSIFGEEGPNTTAYDPLIPIRKQIISAQNVVERPKNHNGALRVGKRFARCLTPKLLPPTAETLSTNRLSGAMFGTEEDGDQINAPFLWTLTIIPDDIKAAIHTKATIMMAQQSAGSFSAKLKKRVEELSWALEVIENEQFVRIIPSLWVFGDSAEKARDAAARAKRIWEGEGYVMQEEQDLAIPLLIAALPGGLYTEKPNLTLMDRDFQVPVSAAARLAPVQADFRGSNSVVVPFIGRKGQVIGMDVYDPISNNHNFLITAGTGAGKSFALNFVCSNYYDSGALVRLLDLGGSYKKLCHTVGGRYLDFGREQICINPFSSLGKDNEDRAGDEQNTATVLAEMVYSASGKSLDETEWTLIKEAVRWALARDGGEMGVDHVFEYLSTYPKYVMDQSRSPLEITEKAKLMGFNLQDWISDGRYGRFANGKSTFDISSDEFVVLELERLKGQPELFKVMTMQVTNACTQDLYLSDRSRRRFILFEEAYQFLKVGSADGNERIGRIIEEGYRRARKYSGSFGIVTQSLNDLLSFGSSGMVIKNNSAYKFLLEADDYEVASRAVGCGYEGLALKLLKGVRTNKPKYSEIFFDGPCGMGIGRLAVDPWTYWVNTSAGNEVKQYEELVEQGLSPYNALKKLSGR